MPLLFAEDGSPILFTIRTINTSLALTSGGVVERCPPLEQSCRRPSCFVPGHGRAVSIAHVGLLLTDGSLPYYGASGSPRGGMGPIPRGSGEAESSRGGRERWSLKRAVGRSQQAVGLLRPIPRLLNLPWPPPSPTMVPECDSAGPSLPTG